MTLLAESAFVRLQGNSSLNRWSHIRVLKYYIDFTTKALKKLLWALRKILWAQRLHKWSIRVVLARKEVNYVFSLIDSN